MTIFIHRTSEHPFIRAQPVSVANHVKAPQSLIERAVTWLATESGWARSKRSAICCGKLWEASLFTGSAAPVAGLRTTYFTGYSLLGQSK